ncbi:MAG: tyrosine-type recombinase/integrase [Sedimenticola sp.]
MTLLSFSGFLRFSEVVQLRRNDINLKMISHAELFISKPKTDKLRKGSSVIISRTGNVTCPVRALERYLTLGKIEESSDAFLFRKISYCKKSDPHKLCSGDHISYSRAREIFLENISQLGLNRNNFGLHSLRPGGATQAANSGVPDRLFKKHGRWKTDNAKDGFVRESLETRKSVSLQLGI